jgi:FkbM family methyltransferase
MYSDQVEVRDVNIDDETNWYWIKGDTGAFEGPKNDWLNSHSTKYFEHLNSFDTVVTAGTNCGMYARFYSRKFKHVYAFEPEPLAFFCMVNNCQSDNVVKLNAALGHGHGLVGILRAAPGSNDMNVGMNQIGPATEEFKIPMLTIDSLGLDACNLIQLDVEGFEKYAIMGAKATIEKFKPVIIAERFSDQESQTIMSDLGYVLSDISGMDAIYVPNTASINKNDGLFVYQA